MRWLAYILFFTVLPALGAEVLRVGSSQQILAVSQDDRQPWKVGDRLCVYEEREEVECGEVTKVASKLAIVRLDSPSDRVFRGARVKSEASKVTAASRLGKGAPARSRRDEIEEPEELLSPPPDVARAERPERTERVGRIEPRRATKAERRPAAKLLTSYDKVEGGVGTPGWNLSGGIHAGLSSFFPMVHLQKSIGSYFALGLMPVFSKTSTTGTEVSALGAVLTFNYYGNEYFRGFWTQVGVGMYKYTADSSATLTTTALSESASSLAVMATAGWRGYWDLGLNVGVGAGLQFIQDANFSTIDIKSDNIQPVIVLDVGVNF